jgi:Protein of unknown function (Hypoth_ymh)
MLHKFVWRNFRLGPRVRDLPTIAANYAVIENLIDTCEGMSERMDNKSKTPHDFLVSFNDARRQIIQASNVAVVLPEFNLYHGLFFFDFLDQAGRASVYLRKMFANELDIDQTAAIVEHMEDEALRKQCEDLLLLQGNYDRVIREATVVLESRLRDCAGGRKRLSGQSLIDFVLPEDVSKAVLRLDDDKEIYYGYRSIIRGVFQAHRNPAVHTLRDVRRIDAARICAYIDMLLSIIDKAAQAAKEAQQPVTIELVKD